MLGSRAATSASRAEGVGGMDRREASSLMRVIAEPYRAGDKVKAAIERARERVSRQLRAAGHAAMEYGRAKRVWKGEARRIDGFELDAIRAAKHERERARLAALTADALANARENERIHDEINGELASAAATFASMRAALARADPDFFREDIDRLGHTIGKLRGRIAPASDVSGEDGQ
jgi:hypothetical protein